TRMILLLEHLLQVWQQERVINRSRHQTDQQERFFPAYQVRINRRRTGSTMATASDFFKLENVQSEVSRVESQKIAANVKAEFAFVSQLWTSPIFKNGGRPARWLKEEREPRKGRNGF